MRRDAETREYLPTTRRASAPPSWPTVGDLFQSFFVPSFLGSNTGVSMPAMDLTEKADNYTVVVDVPGGRLSVQVSPATTVLTGPAVLVSTGVLCPEWLAG